MTSIREDEMFAISVARNIGSLLHKAVISTKTLRGLISSVI